MVFVSTTADEEAVKSRLLISKLVLEESAIGSLGVYVVESTVFKAEVAPIIELLVVKSKLLFSISTFGSTDWKVSAL